MHMRTLAKTRENKTDFAPKTDEWVKTTHLYCLYTDYRRILP